MDGEFRRSIMFKFRIAYIAYVVGVIFSIGIVLYTYFFQDQKWFVGACVIAVLISCMLGAFYVVEGLYKDRLERISLLYRANILRAKIESCRERIELLYTD